MFADTRETKVRPTLDTGPGKTKQEMKGESDINFILKKYQKTGTLSFVNQHQAEYMDVPNIDFQEAMNTINEAEQMFADMPSSLRKEFKNDPGEFLEFVHNPDNADKMYDLGLAQRPADYIPPAATTEPETPEATPPSS